MRRINLTLDIGDTYSHLIDISKTYKSKDISANTFLKIGKPSPENLEPYRFYSGRHKMLKLMVKIVVYFPTITICILREIARILIYRDHHHLDKDGSDKTTDTIFVSHFTHFVDAQTRDQYFGELPWRISSKFNNATIFLLNHTRKKTSQVKSAFSSTANVCYEVNSKTIPLRKLLKEAYMQWRMSLEFLVDAVFKSEICLDYRLLLVGAGLGQFSRATFAAIIFKTNLESFIRVSNPRQVVMTLEGHSYEILAVKMIHTKFPNVKVVFFQHAPVVKGQVSLRENLFEVSQNDLILTTGEAPRQYFLKLNPVLRNQIKILGSPKNFSGNLPTTLTNFRKGEQLNCLFAPESSQVAVAEMFSLAVSCSNALPEVIINFRLHPAYIGDKAMADTSRLKYPENMLFSKQTLTEDLKVADFCVYRSSAVAIEGLIYGCRPLHIGSTISDNLDPLAITSLVHEKFSESSTLMEYLRKAASGKSSELNPEVSSMRMTYAEYFAPLNEETILSLE